ncbi:MAG: radical SAM protein [Thermofilaceae archaeon]
MKKKRMYSKNYKNIVKIGEPIPLIGHLAFGIIDRGTNLLQIRPTSLCPLSCIFCSVDAGPQSRWRKTEYIVELNHLLNWFRWVVEVKGLDKVHAYIDAAGDPLTYPEIIKLVQELKSMEFVETVALETRGMLLTNKLADALDEAGLDRINLSIDALNPELAKRLVNTPRFDVEQVAKVAEYIAGSLRMDLLIAPVWIPGLNNEEIPKIIAWALDIGAGKRWPPLGIQKYEFHKYGRQPRGVIPMKWRDFYDNLRKWENEYGVNLVLKPSDFGIRKTNRVPLAFSRFERVNVKIMAPGWMRNQEIGVARSRVVTVIMANERAVRRKVSVKILRTKNNIYIAQSEL